MFSIKFTVFIREMATVLGIGSCTCKEVGNEERSSSVGNHTFWYYHRIAFVSPRRGLLAVLLIYC